MPSWWPFAVGGAFILSALLTPWWARLALACNLLDRPGGERKQHTEPVPFLGGASVWLALVVPVALVLLFTEHLTAGEIDVRHYLGYLLASVILLIGGVCDDRFVLPPRVSIVFPILAAAVAVIGGIGVAKITNPLGGAFELGALVSMTITFLWLLGMTYTTKLLDGVDGLATGITGVGAVMIALLALTTKFFQPDVALLAGIFAAALFGLFLWNGPPARIYLGEGGSTLLGFTLGVLAVIAGGKLATTLLVMGIPILDAAFVIGRRALERRSLTGGDRTHLHHLLLANGWSTPQILVTYITVSASFGATSLVFASWQKLIALGILTCVAGIAVTVLYRRQSNQKL